MDMLKEEYLTTDLHEKTIDDEDKENQDGNQEEAQPRTPTSKKRIYRHFQRNSPQIKRNKLSEIDIFVEACESTIIPEEDEETATLNFWKTHHARMPKLSLIARKFLAIPASTGSVERLFSIAGSLARARRSRLSAKTIKNLVLYKEFL